MIDYEKTKAWRSDPVRHTYTERDTILYALGVGFAADPLVLEELRFVYEKELQAVPTMAAVLASPGFWMRDRKELGIDYLKLVHGEQGVTIHSPLPAAGTLIGQSRVTRIVDKGEGKARRCMEKTSPTKRADGRSPPRRWWPSCAAMVFSKNGGRACACCACDTRCGAGGDDRNADPRGCRRAVPSRATSIRCTSILQLLPRPDFPDRSCMASQPMATHAAASWRSSAGTMRRA